MRKARGRITPERMEKRIEEYFAAMDATRVEITTKSGVFKVRQKPYTMIGIANALEISRTTLYEYLNGGYPSDGGEKGEQTRLRVQILLESARGRVEQNVVELAALGDMDARIAQLMMGAWGYSTKAEPEHRGNFTVEWEGVEPVEAEEWSQ